MTSLIRDDGQGYRATRNDPEVGVQEVAEFFGATRYRMFGCRYEPSGDGIGGIVVCPSFQAEFLRNYRREVLLGRSLAKAGFAVQRFHYRGTGNSDGETSDVSFESMVADALAAGERLLEIASVSRLAYVGTRLGALVAAGAVAHQSGVPLVLWEPVVASDRYFKEIFRAGRIHELKKGVQGRRSPEDQIEELRRTGTVDVLGYSIDLPLYESALGRNLQTELGDLPRPVFLAEISLKGELHASQSALVERWSSLGFEVEARIISAASEPWWFVGGRTGDDERSLTTELVMATSDWLISTLAHAGAPR